MRKIHVKVTPKDINKGTRIYGTNLGDPSRCPVARAICRSLKKRLGRYVEVNESNIYIYNEPINTPKVASDFIKLFDSGINPPSFEFDLEY